MFDNIKLSTVGSNLPFIGLNSVSNWRNMTQCNGNEFQNCFKSVNIKNGEDNLKFLWQISL